MLTEDVLQRYVDDSGNLHSIKLVTKTNSLPKWAERFWKGPSHVVIIEESVVDPVEQTFTTYSRNITSTHSLVSSSNVPIATRDKFSLILKHSGYCITGKMENISLFVLHIIC